MNMIYLYNYLDLLIFSKLCFVVFSFPGLSNFKKNNVFKLFSLYMFCCYSVVFSSKE